MIGRIVRRAALPVALLASTVLGGCYAYPYGGYGGYGYGGPYVYVYGYGRPYGYGY